MRLIFYDKSDPRVFVYKMPNRKWLGVTLNFAHGKTWLVLLGTLLPVLILLRPLSLLRQFRPPIGYVALWVVVVVAWLVVVVFYYFHMAAKEEQMLRDCPEKIKNRAHWFWWVIVLAALAAYVLVSGWGRWYIESGDDLSSGRPWVRLALVMSRGRNTPDAAPGRGMTLYIHRYAPRPEYSYYQLYDARYSPVNIYCNEVAFSGKLLSYVNRFEWDGYRPFFAELEGRKLSAAQARDLHRRMVDIYHSGHSAAERRAEMAALLKEMKSRGDTVQEQRPATE